MDYLKPELVILVPLMMGLGEVVKKKGLAAKWVPLVLLGAGFVLASVYGLVASTLEGWRFWVDGIVVTGLFHGCVAAFCAMGIFDLGKGIRVKNG